PCSVVLVCRGISQILWISGTFGEGYRSKVICFHHFLIHIQSCIHDCASEADASIVDQDVHVTQGLQDLLSSIYHSSGVREVKHHRAEFELLQSELQDRPLLGRYWEIL
ncbi:hypothetical protein Nmel_014496, partial [Mimus melanotis]